MSLIADFRAYATEVIYRLRRGALGYEAGSGHSPRVVFCIDELDKIVEEGELRNFLRKMKALFEVQGCYYYMSLAEDSWIALYHGASSGKNEVDSALDHIVRIPAADLSDVMEIVRDYGRSRLDDARAVDRMVEPLAAAAFGVPRDALRWCDEWLAMDNPAEVTTGAVLTLLRRRQVALLSEASKIDVALKDALMGASDTSAMACRTWLEVGPPDGIAARGVLLVWLITLVERSVVQTIDEKRLSLLDSLSKLGLQRLDGWVCDIVACSGGVRGGQCWLH
jgi:hypothetical protein